MKPKAIIVDIDGTIADTSARLHHLENNDFKSFFGEMNKDRGKKDVLEILWDLSVKYKLILLTGRPEEYRDVTENWLYKNIFYFDDLFMRENNDYRPDYEIKKEIYLKNIEPYYRVVMVFEDRDPVVNMWRSLGLTCVQVQRDDLNEKVMDSLFKERMKD